MILAMPNHRSYTDDQLRAAVASASCWSDVMQALGKRRGSSPSYAQHVAATLCLDTSHFRFPGRVQQLTVFPPPGSGVRRSAGLGIATAWFASAGYPVLLPVEPMSYDLVIDTSTGFQKVQVKASDTVARAGKRRTVRLTKRLYDPSVVANANGTYRMVPYAEEEVDFFFIIVGDGRNYLIPYDAVRGKSSIVPEDKYQDFLV
jgi:hypothetical protein